MMKRDFASYAILVMIGIASILPATSSLADEAEKPAHLAVLGHTWNYKFKGFRGKVTYTKSTVVVRSTRGDVFKGKLRIKGNKICTKYTNFRNGRETCFKVLKTSKKDVYRTSHGGRLFK